MTNLREKKQEMVRNLNRTAIFDAAVELFKDYGLHGFTMQQVAEKAGMATGTLYLHFKNKEEIIDHVAESLFKQLVTSMTESAAGANCEFEKICCFLRCLLAFGIENRILITLFEQDPAIDKSRQQKLEVLLLMLVEIIEKGIAAREFKKVDPVKSAHYILSLIIGHNKFFRRIQDFDFDQESENMIHFIKPYLVRCDRRTLAV